MTDNLWPGKVTICLLYFQVFDSFTLLGLPQSRRAMSRTWLRAALQKRGNVGTQKRKNGTSHIFNGKWKNGNSVEVREGGSNKFKSIIHSQKKFSYCWLSFFGEKLWEKKKWPNKRLLFNWVPKFPNTPEVSHILFSVPWKLIWLILSCPKNY